MTTALRKVSTEHYIGNITKIGVDIGWTRGGTMVWARLRSVV